MRILQCYAGNLYGGIERQLVMFAQLDAAENPLGKHFALCFAGRLSAELQKTPASIFWMGPIRLSRPWSVWSARRKLRRLLETEHFDVVVCHAMWPHLVFGPIVCEAGVPLVVWAHDTPVNLHWIDRVGMRTKPDLVVANSAYTRHHWQRNYPTVPCEVGYYPLPEPTHDDPKDIRQRMRAQIGAHEDEIVILIASRFEPWKGHQLLLQALSSLRDRSGWQLWVAGGAQRAHERRLVEDLRAFADAHGISDRVRWLGQRSDVFDLMLASDVYCQPNLSPEPFGVVFLEAMHASLAIVTSCSGGPMEFIDRQSGILVEPGNEAQLVDALATLLDDPSRRRALGHAAKLSVSANFSISSRLVKLNHLFAGVMRRTQPPVLPPAA